MRKSRPNYTNPFLCCFRQPLMVLVAVCVFEPCVRLWPLPNPPTLRIMGRARGTDGRRGGDPFVGEGSQGPAQGGIVLVTKHLHTEPHTSGQSSQTGVLRHKTNTSWKVPISHPASQHVAYCFFISQHLMQKINFTFCYVSMRFYPKRLTVEENS